MKNKNKLFFYCCDFAKYRGEGILANNFKSILKKIFKDISIIVYTPENKHFNKEKKINHNFFYKYFTPIFGILIIWVNHLKGNRTAYVNYLPLWNFFLFIFLPKKGDAIIWHGKLIHRGAPPVDKSLTRKSLIGHYCNMLANNESTEEFVGVNDIISRMDLDMENSEYARWKNGGYYFVDPNKKKVR